ncbi:hypothetical protein C8R45DRAFT_1078627 [Mycena sanguinolenta]|nr:hypothetical protein C8R45DRAFT_1078627 [Mycena sanguinolenta]
MSLSSYIKRQSRVLRRSVVSGAGLSSILEDPEPICVLEPTITPSSSTAEETKPTKKNSMKAKRRLGVSDLSIPHTSPLFTAVQGLDFEHDITSEESCSEWRLRLPDDEDEDDTMIFDFPRPPSVCSVASKSSESSGSGSGSTSPTTSVSSGLPTTPTPSPTLEGCAAAAATTCVVRCKSIKPLTITKRSRSASPNPPPASEPASCSSSPAASSSSLRPAPHVEVVGAAEDEAEDEDEDAWQDDDEFYATHASGFITLTPPLPPSFPSAALPSPSPFSPPSTSTSSSLRAVRRESAIFPSSSLSFSSSSLCTPVSKRTTVRLSRPPLPPPLIIASSSSLFSSADGLLKPTSTPTPSSTTSSRSRISASSSARNSNGQTRAKSTRPPPRTPLPTDALSTPWSGDYTAWGPLLAPSSSTFSSAYTPNSAYTPSSSSTSTGSPLRPRRFPAEAQGVPSDVDVDVDVGVAADEYGQGWEVCGSWYDDAPSSPSSEAEEGDDGEAMSPLVASPPSPSPAPYPVRARASYSLAPSEEEQEKPHTPAHELRSRWSSSTLSSVRSSHAHAHSPRGFRRYFGKSASRAQASTSTRGKENAKAPARGAKEGTGKKEGKEGKEGKKKLTLTVTDVLALAARTSMTPPSLTMVPSRPALSASASAQSSQSQSQSQSSQSQSQSQSQSTRGPPTLPPLRALSPLPRVAGTRTGGKEKREHTRTARHSQSQTESARPPRWSYSSFTSSTSTSTTSTSRSAASSATSTTSSRSGEESASSTAVSLSSRSRSGEEGGDGASTQRKPIPVAMFLR